MTDEISLIPSGDVPQSASMADDDFLLVSVAGEARRVSKATLSTFLNLPTGFDPRVFLDFDASAGSFPSGALRGDGYVVTTAGTIDGQAFTVGDYIVAKIDDPSTTTYAGNWERYTDAAGFNELRSDVDALENLTFPSIAALQASAALPDDTVVTVAGRPYQRNAAATDVVGTNNNFHDLSKRSAVAAQYGYDTAQDADIFDLEGLSYERDSSIALADSATEDIGVPGLKRRGPTSLRHFGKITEDSTDIAPIVQRALDNIGGEEVLHLPEGVWRWETKVSVNPASNRKIANFLHEAPKLRGAGYGTQIKTSVGNDYFLEVLTPWAGVLSLSTGCEISGFSVEQLGTPTAPKGIRVMGLQNFRISDINFQHMQESVRFDADDVGGGDQQTSANGKLFNLRGSIPSGGTGLKFKASSTGLVTAAYVGLANNSFYGGDVGLHLSGIAQLRAWGGGFTSQATDNIFIEHFGVANRGIQLSQIELGNNFSGLQSNIRAQSWLGGGTRGLRFVRNDGESSRYGYHWEAASGAVIRDIDLVQDQWIVGGTDAFSHYYADSGSSVNGVNIDLPNYILDTPTTAKFARPLKFAAKRKTYTGSGTITLDVQGDYEHHVTVDAGGGTVISRGGDYEHNKKILLKVTNSSGAATGTTLSGFIGASPSVPNGETAWAECVYDSTSNKFVVLGGWTVGA